MVNVLQPKVSGDAATDSWAFEVTNSANDLDSRVTTLESASGTRQAPLPTSPTTATAIYLDAATANTGPQDGRVITGSHPELQRLVDDPDTPVGTLIMSEHAYEYLVQGTTRISRLPRTGILGWTGDRWL